MLTFALSSALTVGFFRIVFLRMQGQLPVSIAPTRLAVIGTGARANQLSKRIVEYGHQAFELVGFVAPAGGTEMFEVPPTQVLGEALQLNHIIQAHGIETVILASTRLSRAEELVIANRVNSMGLRLLQIPNHWGLANPKVSTSSFMNYYNKEHDTKSIESDGGLLLSQVAERCQGLSGRALRKLPLQAHSAYLVGTKGGDEDEMMQGDTGWAGGADAYGAVAQMDPMEQYVQQLIAQGYPEETARAYAQQYAAHFQGQQ